MFKQRKSRQDAQHLSEVVHSDVLPWVFEDFDAHRPLQVLDAGSGCASTVEFFAGFPARVFFLDLLSEVQSEGGLDANAAERLFAQVLEPYQATLFDVCLFWDVLGALETPVLAGLSNALRPYVYSRTRGYAAYSLNPDVSKSYRLLDKQSLRVMPGSASNTNLSLTRLACGFNCFTIERDAVTSERVEVAMLAD